MNHQIVFHSGCIILPSHQQCMRVSVSHFPVLKLDFPPRCSFWNHPLSSSAACGLVVLLKLPQASAPPCLIAGLDRIPKLCLSLNFKCVTYRLPHQYSLLESRRKGLRKQRKGGGVYSVAVLSLLSDPGAVAGCFFLSSRQSPLWVSPVGRRGCTGEPRTGTGKQKVEDLVIIQVQARTDVKARPCLEGPKNVLPCGQQEARSLEPGRSKVRPWSTLCSPCRAQGG